MTSHLIVFDRAAGAVLVEQAYDDHAEALRARFAAERQYRGGGDIEVVVLNAESGAALRKTHRRYFNTISDMIEAAS